MFRSSACNRRLQQQGRHSRRHRCSRTRLLGTCMRSNPPHHSLRQTAAVVVAAVVGVVVAAAAAEAAAAAAAVCGARGGEEGGVPGRSDTHALFVYVHRTKKTVASRLQENLTERDRILATIPILNIRDVLCVVKRLKAPLQLRSDSYQFLVLVSQPSIMARVCTALINRLARAPKALIM